MFDKLIVSEPEGADFKNRRSYFLVSSVVVGALFLTAVVISIYSADIGLGVNQFELSTMLPPVTMSAEVPEPPKPREPAANVPEQSAVPTRTQNMARVDEPTIVPTTTSMAPNTSMSRPDSQYKIDLSDTNSGMPSGSGRDSSSTGTPNGNGLGEPTIVAEAALIPEPPPIKAPPVKPQMKTLGVINGRATYLPPPPYPQPAKAIGLSGKVDVQVMIDETGKVVSANAVTGHPFLKGAAEKAAWNARFSPTYLSKVPVKVTGVIVYNFVR